MPRLKDFSAGPDMTTVYSAELGDAEAFERIYQIHRRRIYWLCLRMVHNPRDAEDLTQEVFLSVFRKIHTFRGEAKFSTWLYRIALNTVLMHFRKTKKDFVSLETFSERDWQLTDARVTVIFNDEKWLSGKIDPLWLREAVAHLPLGYKTMFVLHDVHGYEHHEIAKIMGCSVGNTKSQLHKARLRLRQLFQDA